MIKSVLTAIGLSLAASGAIAATVTSGPSSSGGPLGAGNSTITVGPNGASFSEFYLTTDPQNAVSFTIEAAYDLLVTGFSISATGALADLQDITFTSSFSAVENSLAVTDIPMSSVDFGGFTFTEFLLSQGDIFTVIFNGPLALDSTVDFSDNVTLTASALVAPVPIPAALPLMMGGLGGLVLLRRSRKA